MNLRKYLVVNSRGAAKLTANKPSLAVDEIAVQLNIQIPNELFRKPTLVADITVDESLATQSLISAEVIDNARQLLSDSLGLQLRISSDYLEKGVAEDEVV